MTERPTEQTHSRLTGLDAPAPEASAGSRSAAPSAPTLPPMPPAEQERTPLAERLQQKLSSVRQTERNGTDATHSTSSEQTAVRPAVQQASTTAAPVAAAQASPVPAPTPATQQAQSREPAPPPAPRQPTRAARP